MANPRPKFTAWPEQHGDLSAVELHAAYNGGWIGAREDKAAEEELRQLTRDTCGHVNLEEIAHANGWADSAAGKLVLSFLHAEHLWPGCLPGDRQTVGSCVSHSTAKALLITLACEIVAGQPDPLTGMLEGPPEVPAEGIASGVIAPQPIYWARGYSSHGWSCPTAAKVAVNKVGCVVMQNYSELGVDLTNVDRRTETLYGSKQPPEAWQTEFAKHRVASAAECNSFEEIRDSLANGYGVTSCGSEGFSSKRNEDGVSERSGSWAHAMAYVGADDRPETHSKYGGPLVLVQNSWEAWNSGPQQIRGTNWSIPVGSFWARWDHVKRRYAAAFANVAGWPPQKLPDYLGGVL